MGQGASRESRLGAAGHPAPHPHGQPAMGPALLLPAGTAASVVSPALNALAAARLRHAKIALVGQADWGLHMALAAAGGMFTEQGVAGRRGAAKQPECKGRPAPESRGCGQ